MIIAYILSVLDEAIYSPRELLNWGRSLPISTQGSWAHSSVLFLQLFSSVILGLFVVYAQKLLPRPEVSQAVTVLWVQN